MKRLFEIEEPFLLFILELSDIQYKALVSDNMWSMHVLEVET